MHTADVVIIGGGIVGSSIAYHLVAAGCTSVLVLEREAAQGLGSTGKSMGGVRAQFSTPVNIQMSLYSIPFYSTFEERLGHPCDYRPQGYLFCATTENQVAYLRANCEKQIAMGLKTVRLVTGDEIRAQFPQLRGDDILGGSFCSTDGFVDPYSAMVGFMSWACDHGATLWKHAAVESITRSTVSSDHATFEVATTRGPVSTPTVVNCAGAWSPAIAPSSRSAACSSPPNPSTSFLTPRP
jgi:sarcosine oxidase subunit beta